MSIQFDMDKYLHQRLSQMCDEFGIDVETMLKMFITTATRKGEIPFKIDDHILQNEILEQKDRSMKKYIKYIKPILDHYTGEEKIQMREKIAEDIYNIEAVASLTPKDYFKLALYKSPKKEWQDAYISDDFMPAIRNQLNTPVKGVDMGDKYVCYQVFRNHYGREMIQLSKKIEKYEFVSFVKIHGQVVVKPRYGAHNMDIRILRYDSVLNWDVYVDDIFKKYKDGVVAEEMILQDSDIALFHPFSINTLRVIIFGAKNKTYVLAFLRIGTDNSLIDMSSKSIMCRVNPVTGEVLYACNRNGESVEVHPDTNVRLLDTKIPGVRSAVLKAKELAKIKPNYKYVAFDFAKTGGQWILVDFNNHPSIMEAQMVMQQGLKQELYRLIQNNQCGQEVSL